MDGKHIACPESTLLQTPPEHPPAPLCVLCIAIAFRLSEHRRSTQDFASTPYLWICGCHLCRPFRLQPRFASPLSHFIRAGNRLLFTRRLAILVSAGWGSHRAGIEATMTPNPITSLDAAGALCLHCEDQWRGASEFFRSVVEKRIAHLWPPRYD